MIDVWLYSVFTGGSIFRPAKLMGGVCMCVCVGLMEVGGVGIRSNGSNID